MNHLTKPKVAVEMKKVTPYNHGAMMDYVGKHQPIYPSFSLTEADLLEVKDWDPDKEYTMHMHVRMVSKEITPQGFQGHFEIMAVGIEEIEGEETDV